MTRNLIKLGYTQLLYFFFLILMQVSPLDIDKASTRWNEEGKEKRREVNKGGSKVSRQSTGVLLAVMTAKGRGGGESAFFF